MTDSPKPHPDEDLSIPRRPRWKYVMAAAGLIAALSWVLLLSGDDESAAEPHVLEPAEPASSAAPTQQAPTASTRTGAAAPARRDDAVPAAPADPAADARDLQALGSDNAGDRIEALRSIRDRGAVALLPKLLELEPMADPDAAPTLIKVSADLAQRVDGAQRAAAADRLADWLEDETQRAEADARANVSVIVESLGTLESPESVRALVEALESDELPVHVATLAARGLSKLGDPSARAAVERFRARVAGTPAADGFQKELYAEALAAADSALSQWH